MAAGNAKGRTFRLFRPEESIFFREILITLQEFVTQLIKNPLSVTTMPVSISPRLLLVCSGGARIFTARGVAARRDPSQQETTFYK